MEDLKHIVAGNITALRQSRKMTQIELAEKLNYSDKAVSKWERGESLPDVTVLKTIADLFGVSLDYLVEAEHPAAEERLLSQECAAPAEGHNRFRIRTIVTALSVLIGWFAATFSFVLMDLFWPDMVGKWLPFVYAVPVSMIVWLVFNSIWFNSRRNYLIISLLMWSVLLSVVLTVLTFGAFAWKILLLGIPGQMAVYMWSRFRG